MNTIRITPAQIISVAAQFDKASKYIQHMNDNLVNQLLSMEFVWDGITKQQFYSDFNIARKGMEQFVSLTSSISFELLHIAHKFMLADSELLNPPPYVDSRNGWEKSLDSLKEMGSDILEASDERYANQFSSVGGFLDYWTAGIPKAFYQGLVERSVKAFDTPNDFANYMTLGIHGTIREGMFPSDAWSKEHLAGILGTAGLFAGGALIKPKDILSPSVKNEVKGSHGLKPDEGGGVGGKAKAEGTGNFSSNFANRELLEGHYEKHGGEFKEVYKNADEYLQGANDVMNGGTKVEYEYKLTNGTVETRTGYVKFMGNTQKGEAKFEFVGTNYNGDITTYHVKRGEDLWKLLNGNKHNKTINPFE